MLFYSYLSIVWRLTQILPYSPCFAILPQRPLPKKNEMMTYILHWSVLRSTEIWDKRSYLYSFHLQVSQHFSPLKAELKVSRLRKKGGRRSRGQRSFASEIPLQGGAGGRCQSSFVLNRAYSDLQLLLTEEILEGQDRGEVRWWLNSPHGTDLLDNALLVPGRTQKILKFLF